MTCCAAAARRRLGWHILASCLCRSGRPKADVFRGRGAKDHRDLRDRATGRAEDRHATRRGAGQHHQGLIAEAGVIEPQGSTGMIVVLQRPIEADKIATVCTRGCFVQINPPGGGFFFPTGRSGML